MTPSITSAAPTGRLIVEYGDYECPYSRKAFREIERVERRVGRVSASPSGTFR